MRRFALKSRGITEDEQQVAANFTEVPGVGSVTSTCP